MVYGRVGSRAEPNFLSKLRSDTADSVEISSHPSEEREGEVGRSDRSFCLFVSVRWEFRDQTCSPSWEIAPTSREEIPKINCKNERYAMGL